MKFLKKIFCKADKFIPREYVLFNVDTFNTWFCDEDNNAVYANRGIFLRTNKLGMATIYDYLLKCHGIDKTEVKYDDVLKFYNKILQDWRKRQPK